MARFTRANRRCLKLIVIHTKQQMARVKRAMTVLTNLLRKPTLLLFHINLLRNANCILGVGLGYGAVVDGFAV